MNSEINNNKEMIIITLLGPPVHPSFGGGGGGGWEGAFSRGWSLINFSYLQGGRLFVVIGRLIE